MKKLIALIILLAAAAVEAQSASLRVSWDAPTGAYGLLSYRVYASRSGTNVLTSPLTTNLTCTLSGFVSGVTYSFTATATDTNGLESVPSYPVVYAVPTNPPAPTNLRGSIIVTTVTTVTNTIQFTSP